jgi:hypothetical protein
MNAVNYSSLDLIYRPRNMRVHKLYGFSPVEQIIMTVNIALRRQMWQLAYFTDGNIPDSLIGVPSTWTPDQIKQFQDWFDSMLLGNLQGRRSARFVPGEVAKSYVPTKEAEIFGAAEEWLSRVICFCFGVSHQALVKEVNKATAETALEQAKMDGMAPIMNWIKGLHDSILIDHFGEQELEFSGTTTRRWTRRSRPTSTPSSSASSRPSTSSRGPRARARPEPAGQRPRHLLHRRHLRALSTPISRSSSSRR